MLQKCESSASVSLFQNLGDFQIRYYNFGSLTCTLGINNSL